MTAVVAARPFQLPCATIGLYLLAACGEAGVATRHVAPTPVQPAVAPAPLRLHFGGFSSVHEVFSTRLLPAFARRWEREHGQALVFVQRYAGSETLARAIGSDFAADLAVFPFARDLDHLRERRLLGPPAQDRPHGGIAFRTLVVLSVRKGNPLGIRDWVDLARPGVRVVTPDPATSGGGILNLCALYGAAMRGHAGVAAGDESAARDLLARVAANVVARAADSSASFQSFREGLGDVAITYESEVTLGWLFGHDEERVIPTSTLVVESPVVGIDEHIAAHGNKAVATALLEFLWTPQAQRHFANCGLRPVDAEVANERRSQFPEPVDPWHLDSLGDWQHITHCVLDVTVPSTPVTPGR